MLSVLISAKAADVGGGQPNLYELWGKHKLSWVGVYMQRSSLWQHESPGSPEKSRAVNKKEGNLGKTR